MRQGCERGSGMVIAFVHSRRPAKLHFRVRGLVVVLFNGNVGSPGSMCGQAFSLESDLSLIVGVMHHVGHSGLRFLASELQWCYVFESHTLGNYSCSSTG